MPRRGSAPPTCHIAVRVSRLQLESVCELQGPTGSCTEASKQYPSVKLRHHQLMLTLLGFLPSALSRVCITNNQSHRRKTTGCEKGRWGHTCVSGAPQLHDPWFLFYTWAQGSSFLPCPKFTRENGYERFENHILTL